MELPVVVFVSFTLFQWTGAQIRIDPQNLAPIEEGDEMTINCILENPVFSRVEWWKEKVKLSKDSINYFPHEYLVTHSSTKFTGLQKYVLHVQNVTKENDGLYKCKAFRTGISKPGVKLTIPITVRYKPQPKYPLCEFNTSEEFAVCVSEIGNPSMELGWQMGTFASRSAVAIDSEYESDGKFIHRRIIKPTNIPTPFRNDDYLFCVFSNQANRNCTLNYEDIYNTLSPPSISPNMTVSVGDNATVNCTMDTALINVTVYFNYFSFPRQVFLENEPFENSLQFIRLPQGITRIEVSCHLRWGPLDNIRSDVSSITILDARTFISLKPSIPTHFAKNHLTDPTNSLPATQTSSPATILYEATAADFTTDASSKLSETAISGTESFLFSTVTSDTLPPRAFPTAPPLSRQPMVTSLSDSHGRLKTDLSFTEYQEMVDLSSNSFATTYIEDTTLFPDFLTTPSSNRHSMVTFTTPSSSRRSMGTFTSDPNVILTKHPSSDERQSTPDLVSKSVSSTHKAITLSTKDRTPLGKTTMFASDMDTEKDPTSFPNDFGTEEVGSYPKTPSLAAPLGTSAFVSTDGSSTKIKPVLTSTNNKLDTTESFPTTLTSEQASIMKTASPLSTTLLNESVDAESPSLLTGSTDLAGTTLLGSTFLSNVVGDTHPTTTPNDIIASSSSKTLTDISLSPSKLVETTLTTKTSVWRISKTSPASGFTTTLPYNEPTTRIKEYHTTVASYNTTKHLSSTSMRSESSLKPVVSTSDEMDPANTSESQQSASTDVPPLTSTTMFQTNTSANTSKTTLKHSGFTTTKTNFPAEPTSEPTFVYSTRKPYKTQQVGTPPKENTSSSSNSTGDDGASQIPPSPPDKLRLELWLLILLVVAGIALIVVTWYITWFKIRPKCTQHGQYKVVTKPVWVSSSPGTIGLHEIHL